MESLDVLTYETQISQQEYIKGGSFCGKGHQNQGLIRRKSKGERIRIESFGTRLSTRDCSPSEAELIKMVHHRVITHSVVFTMNTKTLTTETCWSTERASWYERGMSRRFMIQVQTPMVAELKPRDAWTFFSFLWHRVPINGMVSTIPISFFMMISSILELVMVSNDPLLEHASPTESCCSVLV